VTIQDAAREAIIVQDAVNLSGVLHSFSEIVSEVVWPEARKQGKGTDFVNRHPIVTLFLSTLASLNGTDCLCTHCLALFNDANRECESIAREEVQS
jgi:hypothetical protein